MTTTSDGESGSLRDVISQANQSDATNLQIAVPPGTYTLTRCSADDDNAGGDLDLTTSVPVLLVGTGPGVVIQQTCAGERVLEQRGTGLLTLRNVTLTGGDSTEDGGALRGGSVGLIEVTLTANRAANGGAVQALSLAADQLTARGNTASGRGGAVHVAGNATLTRSTIADNVGALGGGLSVDGTLTVSDTRVTANRTDGYSPATLGAGILADTVHGDRVTIDNNHLHTCDEFSRFRRTESRGGGICANTVSLTNATVTNNTAPECPIFNTGLERMLPPTGLALSAGMVTLDHVTIADNRRVMTLNGAPYPEDSNGVQAGTLVPERSILVIQSDGLLEPLADNGGLVPTRLPLPVSGWVDAIPQAECPTPIDARGVSRPQGTHCDVGAVETAMPPEFGDADVSVAFVNPPASVVVGRPATWQVTVENKGPNSVAPQVFIENFNQLRFTSATLPDGACRGDLIDRFGWPTARVRCDIAVLPAGGRQTITLVGELLPPEPMIDPTLTARVTASRVLPPLEDDQATLTTPLSADASLRMEVSAVGTDVSVSLFNLGPYPAVSTALDPIDILFHPAPGVSVVSSTPLPYWLRLLPVNPEAPGTGAWFSVSFEGPAPAQLGTVELRPSVNRVTGPTSIPVFYVPPAP